MLRLCSCMSLLGDTTNAVGCSCLRAMFRERVEETVCVVRVIAAVVVRGATGLCNILGRVSDGSYLATTISLLLGLGFIMLSMPVQ